MDHELIAPEERDMYPLTPFMSYARAQRRDKQDRDADVGDVVHFWDMVDARCRAAIVTQEDEHNIHTVWLNYLMPGEPSMRCVREVPHDETKGGPSWHWPCGGH